MLQIQRFKPAWNVYSEVMLVKLLSTKLSKRHQLPLHTLITDGSTVWFVLSLHCLTFSYRRCSWTKGNKFFAMSGYCRTHPTGWDHFFDQRTWGPGFRADWIVKGPSAIPCCEVPHPILCPACSVCWKRSSKIPIKENQESPQFSADSASWTGWAHWRCQGVASERTGLLWL